MICAFELCNSDLVLLQKWMDGINVSKINPSTGSHKTSGHRSSDGLRIDSKFVQNFNDPQIQRHYIEYLNNQSSVQSQNPSYFHQHTQNTSDSCDTKCISHQLHRLSITAGTKEVGTTCASEHGKKKNSSSSPSTSQRTPLIAEMFVDAGYTGNTLAEQLQLSSYQIHLLQQSWQRLRCSPNFFVNIFRTVIAKNTTAKELFRKTSFIDGFTSHKCYDVKEHADSLIELIDFSLQEIRNSANVVQHRCMLMGAAHCNTCEKSMSSSWDQFGDSLAESIAKAEAIRGKRKGLKAWNVLLSFIVDRIKNGYLTESKRRASKKSSIQEDAGPS